MLQSISLTRVQHVTRHGEDIIVSNSCDGAIARFRAIRSTALIGRPYTAHDELG